jgi:methylphosphotriester-DNA--protein-cysteine methyltransferase
MVYHSAISTKEIHRKIRMGEIQLAGYTPTKIYGMLQCNSGKRMKRENRVFFASVEEAKQNGYRPCGNCMRKAYRLWKNSNKRVE